LIFKVFQVIFRVLLIFGFAVGVSSCATWVTIAPLNSPVSTCVLEQAFGEYLGTYEGVDYNGYHTGIDLIVEPGTPVSAMATGKVIRVGLLFDKASDGGWYTVIDHESIGIHTQYLHTKEPRVKLGDFVQKGEVIADVIQPTLFPAHLHIEVKPRDVVIRRQESDLRRYWIDPMPLMQTWCKELP
jgi:murein DD-endopeptidase MepM/ murein hydrolase activator NlpD